MLDVGEIIACRRCPRLIEHCAEVARVKRRAYRDQNYWGKPVPSFGDPGAPVMILGLAPGAHGANRTGRVFTGDSSGDLLYRVLYATGFASQASSTSRALLGNTRGDRTPWLYCEGKSATIVQAVCSLCAGSLTRWLEKTHFFNTN